MIRFKELRENKGLSLEKLGSLLNINASTLSRIENGQREAKQSTLEEYADFFNVSIDYLLGKTDNPKLNVKDEKDIDKDLKVIMDDFRGGQAGPLYYDGVELAQEDLDKLEMAMRIALETAKVKNKEKYTPKKYKK